METNTEYEPKKSHSVVLWCCISLILGGLVLFWRYYNEYFVKGSPEQQASGETKHMDDRPPYSSTLKHNLELERDTGEKVNIGQLEGKVWLAAYIYTRCPRGCNFVADKLKMYTDKYGSNPLFRSVAITLNPEEDSIEFLKSFRESKGMLGDNYWFLRGDGPIIRNYMQDEFKLIVTEIPEKERMNAYDRWNHKLAIVLVDHQRRIRRTADFGDLSVADIWEKQLDRDITFVLKEAADRK